MKWHVARTLITLIIIVISIDSFAQVTGHFKDKRDGKKYKTVKIGLQTWMAENLAFKSDTGCFAYNDSISNVATYGYLYKWETARNVCPCGWHLPTDAKWSTLISNLGGDKIAGAKLKAVTSWKHPVAGANDSCKFGALAAGLRDFDGTWNGLGTTCCWWSATDLNSERASDLMLLDSSSSIIYTIDYKQNSYPIRCLKNK